MAGRNGAHGMSQAERVYESLRERLLRGDLPVGRRHVEQQLAAELKTSRTPAREALVVRERVGSALARTFELPG